MFEPTLLPGLLGEDRRLDLLRNLAVADLSGRLIGAEDHVAFMAYGAPATDALLSALRPAFEHAVGEGLVPSYSFLWLYKHGADVPRHRDRATSEIVATVQLASSQSEPWPFVIAAEIGEQSFEIGAGDAVVFEGHRQAHWRQPLAGSWHLQVVLSYVRSAGLAVRPFDGRTCLGADPLPEIMEFPVDVVRLPLAWDEMLGDPYLKRPENV